MLKLAAIILAAGKGSRIGKPKWQLLYNGKTFLDIILSKLQDIAITDIVVVANPESIPDIPSHANLVVNSRPEYGMISSIYCGIKSLPDAAGYMIFPVDHPLINAETLKLLHVNFLLEPQSVIIPNYHQHSGHPIIIPQHIAAKIPFEDYPGGLRRLLLTINQQITKVQVTDPNILKNINTVADLS